MTASPPLRTGLLLVALGAAVLAPALGGCRGDRTDARPRQFFPDMDDQPKWNPQSETEFFVHQDGTRRTQRTPDANTVAFARRSFNPEQHASDAWAKDYTLERASFLAEDDAYYTGQTAPDSFVAVIPATVTREMIELGRQSFEINCVACHGYKGDGQGTVAKLGYSPVPANLLDPKFSDPSQRSAKDGHMFSVIRDGLWNDNTGANRMPAYGHNVSPDEAWAVVAYIRVLQAAQNASFESANLSDAVRSELLRTRPAAPASEGGAP